MLSKDLLKHKIERKALKIWNAVMDEFQPSEITRILHYKAETEMSGKKYHKSNIVVWL